MPYDDVLIFLVGSGWTWFIVWLFDLRKRPMIFAIHTPVVHPDGEDFFVEQNDFD